jgi:hypothetical protein
MTAASWVPVSIIMMVTVLDNWWPLLQYVIFVVAGCVQGALIGFGQALGMRGTKVAVPGRTWIAASSLGAGLTYGVALIPGFFFQPDLKNIVVASLAALFVILVLSIFPFVQARVLRYRVRDSWRWVAITTGSWLLCALIFALFGLLIRGDVNLVVAVVVMTFGGTVALLVLTLLEGAGMKRLSRSDIANPKWGNILPDTPRVVAARKKVGSASVTAQAKAKVVTKAAKKRAAVVAKGASKRASSAASRVKKKR